MNEYELFTKNVNVNNCNARLSYLYKQRDHISELISNYIGASMSIDLEKSYNDICDVIDILIDFRRNNSNCLLEGDEGYSL